jgi:hypothetical protein
MGSCLALATAGRGQQFQSRLLRGDDLPRRGGVQRATDLPFSLALTFLVLPIILHKPTRDQLPKKANATFVGWAAEHGGLLAGLPDRATRLLPVSREALLFLLQNEVMRIQQGGVVVGENPIRLSTRPPAVTGETDEARRSAGLLGRWFANQGQATSIMQVLGVAP